MAAKIKKGDKVVVIAGRDKGRTGEVIEVHPRRRPRAGARRQHGQAPSAPERQAGGRHHLQGGADPSVQPRDRRSQGRQADARRLQDSRRRPQGARRQAFGRSRSMADSKKRQEGQRRRGKAAGRRRRARRAGKAAKAQGAPREGGRRPRAERQGAGDAERGGAERRAERAGAAEDAVRRGDPRRSSPSSSATRTRLQVPTIDKIVINMGVGEAVNDTQEGDVGGGRSRADRRPEAGDHQGAQVDRDLQGAREHADRLQGDAAQDAHVRVPRPAGQHRAAARARLPRPQSEELRRPRQLRARHQGAHRVPGDRLRQGRRDVWGMDIIVCTTARRPTTRRAPC